MFKKIIVVLVVAIILSYAAENTITTNSSDMLAVPQLLNYQGKLTQISGTPVNDSTYSITFRMFTSATGGTAFWNETQSVQTSAGLFNCLLGSSTPITSIPDDGNCYFEMQVNPNPAMTPRIRLTSSAYAFLAKKADTASYALSANIQYVDSARVAVNAYNANNLQGKDTTALDNRYVNEAQINSITSSMITDNTIVRVDVATNFKSPNADSADYVRNINVPYVDSSRVSVNAYNAHKIQGKDTLALDARYINEGQESSIISSMITDGTIVNSDISGTAGINDTKLAGTATLITNFNADLLDNYHASSFSLTGHTHSYVDSARVAVNAYKLQGMDTTALNTKFVDEGQINSITSSMITDNTIVRTDVATNFKSPDADSADYVRNINVPYVDSTRVSVNAYNAYKIQGKDTVALSAKYVDEGQVNAITNPMITDNAVTSNKIADGTIARADVATNFKSPDADSADYVRNLNVPYVDSSRVSVNAYNANQLQGKDTLALSTKYVDEGQVNAITNPMITDNAVTSDKITDGTIARVDVATNFKSPDADSADYVRNLNVPYVDSSRVSVNAYNANQLQGKDTLALSTKYVDEGQVNAITNPMITDNAVTSDKITDGTIARVDVATNFKAPDADSADYVRNINVPYVDSARVAVNAYNANNLQGKDTTALSAKFVDEGQSAGGDLTGTYPNPTITTNAVTSSKIFDGAVTTTKIADLNITTGKIADAAVTLSKHADNSVNSAKIVDGSIGTVDLNFTPVTRPLTPGVATTEIADDAITSAKIQDGQVQAADIADLNITTGKIGDGQVTSAKIPGGAITNNILADNAVTTDKILDGTVMTLDIADTNVTMAKIQQKGATTGQVIKWNGSTWIPSNDSAGGPPTGSAGGDLTGTYPNPTIADNAIASAKISDGTILGDDIAKPLNLQGSVNWPNGILHIRNNGTGRGIVIDSAGFGALHVNYAFADGISIAYAAQSGLSIDTVGGSAIRIISTSFDGIGVDEAGYAALYAMHVGTGVQIDSSESDGVYAYGNLSGGNLIAANPGAVGLYAHAYNNTSTDTAIQAYGSGFATGGWYTGGLSDNKSAPCLISSEFGIVTSGTGILSNGEAMITFDPLFADNIRTDIPIRITVTPKGKPAGFLYVAESKASEFKVAIEAIPGLEKNGKDMTFDWIAVGTLKENKTTPQAQAQWQKMIQERDAKRDAAKLRNAKLQQK